jgi:hypothetical protein
MRLIKSITVAALALSAATTSALSQETFEWRQVGDWTIGVDTTLGDACYALNAFTDGTALRIGFDNTNAEWPWYIMFGNDAWQSLETDVEYEMSLKFDNETPWSGPAVGVPMGDMVFLHMLGADVEFFDEFILKDQVAISYDGRTVATLSLAGSARATEALLDCQDEQDAANVDPFAGGKTKKKS